METVFAAFTRAGSRDGIALCQHACARYRGITYVSAMPSAPDAKSSS
jgi:hypothetical protein